MTAKRKPSSRLKQTEEEEDGGGGTTKIRQTLLIVFIHGFKGSDKSTFADFPDRVAHIVRQTYPSLVVTPIIYPTYETRGSLSKAVEGFVDWLTTRTVEIECEPQKADDQFSEPGGAGSVKIVLCGHSMGGLVAVDAALEIGKSAHGTASSKLWPRVCGVLAFDTPYYGVHPNVFKHTANKVHGYYQSAQKISSQLAPVGTALATWWGASAAAAAAKSNSTSSPGNTVQQTGTDGKSKKSGNFWSSALIATGAVALAGGAAAGTLYGGGWTYMNDHFLYVSNLWDNENLKARLDAVIDMPQIFFHALYNRLPPISTVVPGQPPRTFIILPQSKSRTLDSFEAVDNATASDEIDAHTTMFYSTSSSYYRLGLRAAELIVRCLDDEERYGDQVHSQREGDREHGTRVKDDEEAPPTEAVPPPSEAEQEAGN